MSTRYDTAKDIGFQESDSSPGLLWWKVKDHAENLTIFLDFRDEDEQGEYTGEINKDMPPRIYGAVEPEDEDTEWINKHGDTRQRWKDEVKGHWVVNKVEEDSGLDSDDGQASLDWFSQDGMVTETCEKCGEDFEVSEMEKTLCIGEDTNQCYYDEHPEELFRKAKKRKREIRQESKN